MFIDMTAMSDVTVLLLTFFMLTANFVKKEPVQVEPEMTVCARKQLNLRTAAEAWIRIKGENTPVHFDIVSVVLDGGDIPKVLRLSHIPDAYFPIGR